MPEPIQKERLSKLLFQSGPYFSLGCIWVWHGEGSCSTGQSIVLVLFRAQGNWGTLLEHIKDHIKLLVSRERKKACREQEKVCSYILRQHLDFNGRGGGRETSKLPLSSISDQRNIEQYDITCLLTDLQV